MTSTIKAALLCSLVLMSGCRRTPPVSPDAADGARECLTTVLDAWKQRATDSLSQRTLPIRFVDEDLAEGWPLVDYEIGTARDRRDGVVILEVQLTVREPAGESVRRKVEYQVAPTAPFSVLRSAP
ncbi:MAG: hypothetical protein EHM42_00535 [Planctomycetaceae bacterium]|nr:MAG: hypothetical protein EHM42_00535 [Planctomycetaceae bacterium]